MPASVHTYHACEARAHFRMGDTRNNGQAMVVRTDMKQVGPTGDVGPVSLDRNSCPRRSVEHVVERRLARPQLSCAQPTVRNFRLVQPLAAVSSSRPLTRPMIGQRLAYEPFHGAPRTRQQYQITVVECIERAPIFHCTERRPTALLSMWGSRRLRPVFGTPVHVASDCCGRSDTHLANS